MSAVASHLTRTLLELKEERRVDSAARHFGIARPAHFESWSAGGPEGASEGPDADRPSDPCLEAYVSKRAWVAPEEPICFLTDLHADREAFWRSLLVAGLVGFERDRFGRTGSTTLESVPDEAFFLTDFGRETHYVVGGDLFDKGPANLPLLDALSCFRALGARFTLLAGNHDVRTFLGIRFAESKDPRLAHLFVRMGKKTMTLFKEIFDAEVAGSGGARLSDAEVRERLFPAESWFDDFPRVADGLVPPARIAKELGRVREKISELEQRCHDLGMSLGDVYETLQRCRRHFLEPDGRLGWVFGQMQIAHREGSLLFAHAGVDDVAADWIAQEGVDGVRARFRAALENDPFELYNGPLGNMFRTKYRDLDLPFTERGLRQLHRVGIHAIVHGHRNVFLGQHMNFRRGMLNFACDACIDRNTRQIESLPGDGSAATIIAEDGTIYGLSADHPAVKVFDPTLYGGWVTCP
jgi:hypothetical protein